MSLYNFKQIRVVPPAQEFIDAVLSRTQRQTPTVCHKRWKVTRIRQFYMRKVKHTQTTWHEALSKILEDFPKVDDIHPFYADLLNVLYDRDHYKLALGQLNVARNLIDRIGQDYVRLLKYGDSQYRCKQLKRAALGRMATIMRKQGPSTKYLEQVRQHMSRLPSIDPNTRTLLMCGYPNVGKSSFMNTVTRADVEVEPYAFTTKSLYVGHMDYKYLRWQVIDTPGLLDRPLEDRNTIEMQSITALAHLRAAVLYIVDISEQCGHTIAEQAALFKSVKPLFANKPVMIVCNKTDARKMEDLSPDEMEILKKLENEAMELGSGGIYAEDNAKDLECLFTMSTLTEDNVMPVRNTACERLLNVRVETKMQGKRINNILNRIHVAMPKNANPERKPCIPEGVAEARAKRDAGEKMETEKDLEEKFGGAGVYSSDERKTYLLDDETWKYDIMPEIWDGHNVMDFIDPDINAKLAELELEEEELEAKAEAAGLDMLEEEEEELTPEERLLLSDIRKRKKLVINRHQREKDVRSNYPTVARGRNLDGSVNLTNMQEQLERLGMDPSKALDRIKAESRGRSRSRKKRTADAMEVDDGEDQPPKKRIHSSRSRSMSRGRSLSLAKPKAGSGVKDSAQLNKAVKMGDVAQQLRNKDAKKGEADRHIPNFKPKHLFTGKRGIGKTQRR
ncbi:hypothetical protein BSKO_03180 [Bryopsis sp. KO-2023]|nr:hypothetical protein BSKO_03180 [Bryopsis sp. KO-2023]